MSKRRRWKWPGKGRCGHNHCTDCRTRRGSKRGIRRDRHQAKAALTETQKGYCRHCGHAIVVDERSGRWVDDHFGQTSGFGTARSDFEWHAHEPEDP
jgi:hypothetical protein